MTEPRPPPVDTPTTPRRRRGRALRWVAALLALVAVATVMSGLVWIRTDDFQHRAVPVVEELVEARTSHTFEVERIDVQPWPPAVAFSNPRLSDPETGDTIASARRVRAPLVLRAGGPRLGKLTIESPVLEVHLDREPPTQDPAAAPAAPAMQRVPWTSLHIEDGTVRVYVPDGRIVLTDIQVTPTTGYRADVSANMIGWYQQLEDRAGISLHDVELGPDRIHVPSLLVDTELIRVDGTATIGLDGTIDATLTASADLERVNPLLQDPAAVHGLLDVDATFAGKGKDLSIRTVVQATHLSLDVPGVQVPVVHHELGTVVVAALIDRDGAYVERAVIRNGDGQLEAWGWVTPDLEVRDARVIAEDVGLEHLLRTMDAAPMPWVDLSADLEAQVQGSLKPLHIEGPFELVASDWNVGDRPIHDPDVEHMLEIPRAYASGRLVIEFDHAVITATHVQGPTSRGRADILLGFGPKGPLDLRFDLDEADLSDFQPLGDVGLKGVGRLTGRIAGPFDGLSFEGDGDITGFEVTGIRYADHLVSPIASPHMQSIVLEGAHAELGDTRYSGNFTLDFNHPLSMYTDILIHEGRAEDLIGMFVELEGITGDLEGSLSLAGPLFDMDGEAHLTLTGVDLYGERFPYGEGHGYMDTGVFTLDDLRLLRDDGRAGLILRGSVGRAYALNMEVMGDGFRLESLDHLADVEIPLSGRVSVVARIDNTLMNPAPHGRLAVTDVRYGGVELADSAVRFETTGGVAHYQGRLLGGTVAVAGTQGLWEDQPYSVFASFVDFPLHALYPEGANGAPLEGSLDGSVQLDGNLGPEPSALTLSVDVETVDVSWRRHHLHSERPWHFEAVGDQWALTGFAIEGAQTSLSLDRAVSGPDGLDLRGGGRIDLHLLRLFVPELTRAEGYADLTLTAHGRGKQVETVVDADVVGSLLRHSSFPEAFEDLRATVRATQDGYTFSDVTAGLGGGILTGGGTVDAENWVPRRWNVRGAARNAQVQWIDALPPAIGDADLRFDGPVDALLLSGQVNIRDMAFVERIDWEDWVVEYRDWSLVDASPVDVEPWFSLDVRIRADRTVTLRNNVAEGVASADLRIIGDTARAGMMGHVRIDDALVYLQDREFVVERGIVAYNDPWTWDPDLDIELVTDITSGAEQFRVSYIVRGPFSSWTTETRSDPTLPQADINALLWFGVTAEELEGMGELSQAVAQGVADMILTDLFITRGSGVREELGNFVDKVEIATGVDSRGEYNPDPRLVFEKRLDTLDTTARVEWNLVDTDEVQAETDVRLDDVWSLALWYASWQRDRPLPIGGAYGVDVRARWELE